MPLCCSMSFKVTNFSFNGKPVYDFLCVISNTLPRILHRFQNMEEYLAHFSPSTGVPFNALLWVNP